MKIQNSWFLFAFFFQTVVPIIVQKTNSCMQQVAQTGNKPYIQDFHQRSMKDLYVFFLQLLFKWVMTTSLVWNLCWTAMNSAAYLMPHDHFLKILKYFHFADNQNPSVQDRRPWLQEIRESQINIWHPKVKIFRTVSSVRSYGTRQCDREI